MKSKNFRNLFLYVLVIFFVFSLFGGFINVKTAEASNVSCGSAKGKTYAYTKTSYSPDVQCYNNHRSSNSSFPSAGGSVSWKCFNAIGQTTCENASASRASAPASVNCVGSWSTCNNGLQTYTITTQASNGGISCPYANNTTRSCGGIGACGYSGGGNFYIKPTSGLCANQNSASGVSGSGPWTWSCTGSGGGTVADCLANKKVDGGWTSWSPVNNSCGITYTQTRSCTNPSPQNGGLTCSGSSTQSITNSPCPVNGVCGSSNGTSSYFAPEYGLCNSGSASGVSGSGPWSWFCSGSNGGTSASCSSNKKVDGGWTSWSPVNNSCGITYTQTRSCTNPSPQNGGASCSGSSTQSVTNTPCPSGTLTASPSSCSISINSSSCSVNLTWSTSNPQGTSAITANGMTSVSGNSGSQSFTVPYNGRTFYLYNNAMLLKQVTVSSSCGANTTWNGSTACVLNSYTVSASAGTGGSISPSSRVVSHGSTTTFTATPSSGYTFSSAGGTCGANVSGNTITTVPITSNCTVFANFTRNPINGSCAPTHYNCSSPADSINNSNANLDYFTWTCPGSYNGTNASCSEAKPLATVDLKVDPDSNGPLSAGYGPFNVAQGTNVRVQWSYSADNCSNANGNWTGLTGASSGSTGEVVNNSVTYSLTCSYAYGRQVTKSVTVNVVPPPTVDLLYYSSSGGVESRSQGLSVLNNSSWISGNNGIRWISTNATSCNVSGSWSGSNLNPNSTHALPSVLDVGNYSYNVICSGIGGTATDNVTINVYDIAYFVLHATNGTSSSPTNSTIPHTSSITIPYNTGVTLSWNLSQYTNTFGYACNASSTPSGWSGSKSTTGSESTGNLTSSKTYRITCTSPVFSTYSEVTVNVLPQPTGSLSAIPTTCNISAGSNTCNVSLSWSTTNPPSGSTSAVTSNYPSPGTVVATGNNGTDVSVTIPYSSRTFYLYNNGVLLRQITASSGCTTNTQWNGSTACVLNSYTISASSGANGSISPGTTSVTHGSSKTYTITPNPGYRIANVLVDGSSVGTGGTYTFLNITANHTISATFILNTYTITATDNGSPNGVISPSSKTGVGHFSTTTFTVTPNSGYTASASGCGGSLSGNTYTTGAITSDCTVTATFSLIPLPDLVASAPTPSTASKNIAQTFSANISNNGTASTGSSFRYFFQISTNPDGGPYTDLSSSVTPTLSAGSSRSVTQSYTFTSATTYSIRVCADKSSSGNSGSITESNENNNCSGWTSVTVFSNTCANGATNYPTCTTNSNGSCLNGATNPPNCSTFNTCANGATNYPTCTTNSNGSCLNGANNPPTCNTFSAIPTVTTSAVSNITQTTATGGGNVTSNGGSTVTVSGIVWSTGANPTTANSKTTNGWAIGGPWSSNMTGLTAGTLYHVRAYATNSAGTAYGSDRTFTTSATTVMSGSLSPASPSCSISSGASSCNVNLNWSITNPQATPTAITTSGMSNINVSNSLATPQSGTQSVSVPYTGGGSRTFFLYNNAVSLGQVSATSGCEAGTSWNSSSGKCQNNPSPVNGSCASTHYNCNYPVGGSTNQVDGPSAYTWTCPGSNGGTDASCSESKSVCAPGEGNPCISGLNSCGEYNSGTIECDGSCSAVTPSDDSCVAQTCQDPNATNLNDPLPCTYPPSNVCQDPAATNFNGALPCTYPPSDSCTNGATNPPLCTTDGGDGACPTGYTGTYPDCVGPSGGVCPVGYSGTYPDCVGFGGGICPVGYTGAYPDCTGPDGGICPPTYTGTYPNCVGPVGGGSYCLDGAMNPPDCNRFRKQPIFIEN